MAADRSNDSSTFDALWDFDLDESKEEKIPAALDPRGAGKVPAEKRDTLLPPVPQPDYVQTMMELGELDDPTEADFSTVTVDPAHRRATVRRTPFQPPPGARDEPFAPRPPAPAPPGKPARGAGAAAPFGLVMAAEDELLMPTEGGPSDEEEGPGSLPIPTVSGPGAARAPTGGTRSPARPGGGFPRPPPTGISDATAARLGSTGGPAGRVGMPQPIKGAAGFRTSGQMASVGRGAPMIAGAPMPRAPSIPPPLDDDDPLAGLGSLDMIDLPPAPPRPISEAPRPRITPSRTPPTLDAIRRASPAGFRLKTGPRPPEPELEPGDRPTLEAIEPAPDSVLDAVREMAQRFEARNYGGALVLAESVLVSEPGHAVARRTAESCREMLADKYLSNLGGRNSVPRVTMAPEEWRFLALDHRAGFLLSFIDGSMSIEEVLDVSSMAELEALRIMFELRQQGVIELATPAPRGRR
jgi:hypothetical protein